MARPGEKGGTIVGDPERRKVGVEDICKGLRSNTKDPLRGARILVEIQGSRVGSRGSGGNGACTDGI